MFSLLSELDEDLMLELDDVVRQNQLNCLPISKSGGAEAELIENHPELTESIEHSRRVKMDAISLQGRLHERESKLGSAAKAKADLLEDFEPSPSMQKDRRRSSKDHNNTPKSSSLTAMRSPVLKASKSPVLSARKSAADLMFEMDESDSEGEKGAFQTTSRRRRPGATSESPRLPPSGLGLDDDAFPAIGLSRLPAAATAFGTSAKSPPSYKPSNGFEARQRQSVSGESGARETKGWASSSFSGSKLDMKDIMAQTPSGRASSISSALAAPSQEKDVTSGSLPGKMSQKERKRHQQQQLSQAPMAVTTSSPDLGAMQKMQKTPTSPWQVAYRGTKVNLKDVLDTAKSRPSVPKAAARTPSPMTLRQTVSGKLTPAPRHVSGPAQPTPPPAQQRPTSSRGATTSSRSMYISSPAPSQIQSIRHVPALAEPTLQLSMADILAQQNREKQIIKEAAAKRSLQEIQEEQAFQEWWDLESRRVKEEEEAATSRPSAATREGKAGKGGRGRGGSRMRSRVGGSTKGKGRGDGGGGEASAAGPERSAHDHVGKRDGKQS